MRKFLIALAACLAATFAFALPFAPTTAGTKSATCSSVSAATALAVTLPTNQQAQLELQNTGSVDAYFEFGTSGVTASATTGYPVRPGHSKLVTVLPTTTHFACVTSTSTAPVYVSVGQGDS